VGDGGRPPASGSSRRPADRCTWPASSSDRLYR
jgi:hypothetical protein